MTKTRKGSKFSYRDVRKIAEQPLEKRKELPIGRGGKKEAPRKFHLDRDEIAVLKTQREQGDELPNPHNKGFYHYFIETMKRLGLNRNHSQAVVREKFREVASEAGTKKPDGRTFWQRWSKKEARNEDTARDWHGKFEQNVEVLQRLGGLTPYGLRLKEVGTRVLGTKGCVIDIVEGSGGTVMYRLNTNSDTPINETRVRGKAEGSASKPKPKAKPKRKTAARKATKTKRETPATSDSQGDSTPADSTSAAVATA